MAATSVQANSLVHIFFFIEMNFGIVGAHAARRAASLAAEGKFTQARKSSESSQELLKKSR